MGNAVGIDIEAIAGGQHLAEHRVDAAEQRLMLQLLVAEPDQRLERDLVAETVIEGQFQDRKSTRLNSSHANISYAVFCLKKIRDLKWRRLNFSNVVHRVD